MSHLENGANIGMRYCSLIRMLIPILLVMSSATAFFRGLILLAVVGFLTSLFTLVYRLTSSNVRGNYSAKTKSKDEFIDGKYRIIEDEDR